MTMISGRLLSWSFQSGGRNAVSWPMLSDKLLSWSRVYRRGAVSWPMLSEKQRKVKVVLCSSAGSWPKLSGKQRVSGGNSGGRSARPEAQFAQPRFVLHRGTLSAADARQEFVIIGRLRPSRGCSVGRGASGCAVGRGAGGCAVGRGAGGCSVGRGACGCAVGRGAGGCSVGRGAGGCAVGRGAGEYAAAPEAALISLVHGRAVETTMRRTQFLAGVGIDDCVDDMVRSRNYRKRARVTIQKALIVSCST